MGQGAHLLRLLRQGPQLRSDLIRDLNLSGQSVGWAMQNLSRALPASLTIHWRYIHSPGLLGLRHREVLYSLERT